MDNPLPPGCDVCKSAPFVYGANGGALRCGCERGVRLLAMDKERQMTRSRPPASLTRAAKGFRPGRPSAKKRKADVAKAAANDKEQELFT